MVFAIHQYESATSTHVSPHPETPPISLPTPSVWVVPEHWLWVPCFVHRTCTDHSILHMVIYMFLCYSLKSSHPRLLPQSPNCVSHGACGCHIPLVYFICEFKFNVLARLSRAGPDIYVDSSLKPGHVDDLQ